MGTWDPQCQVIKRQAVCSNTENLTSVELSDCRWCTYCLIKQREKVINRKRLWLPDCSILEGKIHIGKILINSRPFSGISKDNFASQSSFWLLFWEIQLSLCFSSLFCFLVSICTLWNRLLPFKLHTCDNWGLLQETWMHSEGTKFESSYHS